VTFSYVPAYRNGTPSQCARSVLVGDAFNAVTRTARDHECLPRSRLDFITSIWFSSLSRFIVLTKLSLLC